MKTDIARPSHSLNLGVDPQLDPRPRLRPRVDLRPRPRPRVNLWPRPRLRLSLPLAWALTSGLALCPLGAAHAGAKSRPAAEQAAPLDPALRDKAVLCSDGKSHYVIVAPDEHILHRLYYGDGKTFYLVPVDPSGMITGEWFPEPRFYNKTFNGNFRGVDLRHYSRMEVKEGQGCELQCGDHTANLAIVDPAKAKDLLAAAGVKPSPRKAAPYRLARDDNGIYYYVDRGFAPGSEKQFRLFMGPKGNMKQLKMVNVVSDSQGEIFATKGGSLRLILGSHESTWIEGGKEKKLLMVSTEDNEMMIFNELGIYTGERLGTPCDDL